jgi:SAM-dependent methyltransferase
VKDGKVLSAYHQQATAFADFASSAFCWRHFERQFYERHLKEFSGSKTRALDAGCGNGRVIELLLQYGIPAGCIFGVDDCDSMLQLARRQHPRVNFSCQDIRGMDLPTRAFSLVTAHMVLMHIDNHGLVSTFQNIYEHMADDGVLMFVVTHPIRQIKDRAEYGRREWIKMTSGWGVPMDDFLRPVSDYVNFLFAAGFKLEEMDELTVPQDAQEDDPQQYARYAAYGTPRVAFKARK